MKQLVIVLGIVLTLLGSRSVGAWPARQADTPTPPPIRVEVLDEFTNVRAGPGTNYDLIGRMNRGQGGAVLGKVTFGELVWLKVVYIGGPENTGWVFRNNVQVIGDLSLAPDLSVPPTPTLPPTATPGPDTRFGTATPDPNANRPPTFTAPPPVVRPTLLPAIGATNERGFPPALAIFSLFILGGFGLVVSWMRRQQ